MEPEKEPFKGDKSLCRGPLFYLQLSLPESSLWLERVYILTGRKKTLPLGCSLASLLFYFCFVTVLAFMLLFHYHSAQKIYILFPQKLLNRRPVEGTTETSGPHVPQTHVPARGLESQSLATFLMGSWRLLPKTLLVWR